MKDITIKYLAERAEEDFPHIIKQDPFMNFTMMMGEVDGIMSSGKPREAIRNSIFSVMTTYSVIFMSQYYYSADQQNVLDKFNSDMEIILTHLKTCNEVSVAMGVSGHKLDKDTLQSFSGLVKGFKAHGKDVDELFNDKDGKDQ